MREEEASSRNYYLTQAKEQNWSVRTLDRQLKTQTYQRLLSTQQASETPVTTTELSQRDQLDQTPPNKP